jgi:hypothetical protein
MHRPDAGFPQRNAGTSCSVLELSEISAGPGHDLHCNRATKFSLWVLEPHLLSRSGCGDLQIVIFEVVLSLLSYPDFQSRAPTP